LRFRLFDRPRLKQKVTRHHGRYAGDVDGEIGAAVAVDVAFDLEDAA